MDKIETVLTAVELADCVPQTAAIGEKDDRLAVTMTYAELQQFVASAVSALSAKTEAQPVVHFNVFRSLQGERNTRFIELGTLPDGEYQLYTAPLPQQESQLLEAAEKVNNDFSTIERLIVGVAPAVDYTRILKEFRELSAAIAASKGSAS